MLLLGKGHRNPRMPRTERTAIERHQHSQAQRRTRDVRQRQPRVLHHAENREVVAHEARLIHLPGPVHVRVVHENRQILIALPRNGHAHVRLIRHCHLRSRIVHLPEVLEVHRERQMHDPGPVPQHPGPTLFDQGNCGLPRQRPRVAFYPRQAHQQRRAIVVTDDGCFDEPAGHPRAAHLVHNGHPTTGDLKSPRQRAFL